MSGVRESRLVPIVMRLVGTAVVALPCWAIFGYLATAPLGAIYGWSGHPAIPAAPTSVYIGFYLVVLPIVCGLLGWRVAGLIGKRLERKSRDQRRGN
jgi:hypothetical protein